jgi:hypothetical protein
VGNQSSRQRPRRQRVCPHVPFHIRTTLSRRLVGTHRFSPVLDLALSLCECKYSAPLEAGAQAPGRARCGRDAGTVIAVEAVGTSRRATGFRGFSGLGTGAALGDAGSCANGSTASPPQFGSARTPPRRVQRELLAVVPQRIRSTCVRSLLEAGLRSSRRASIGVACPASLRHPPPRHPRDPSLKAPRSYRTVRHSKSALPLEREESARSWA